MRDWPLLEQAVEQIDDQTEFVGWWKQEVTPGQSPGPGGKQSRPDQGAIISMEEAERETGIRHQQVSKWLTHLKNRVKYAELLYGVSYRKAMASPQREDRGTTTKRLRSRHPRSRVH